ncbi:Lrp/AsnC family transcriptional regulator [Actinotalea sp. K2]|uniref:Lrp/AsnC family transcriptional regulator n=1 Tax=Actinotalea sp. K2 TaxID=2939438 RepID=UPI00201795AE|nr:Lrp/AsnC family transcriptional regulator [Actinotalea sp. K2]MCL3859592.1 Lrp/AsnC family transcriptional regulator [Actinotalea sp. K2]
MDPTDREILRELTADARVTFRDLGARVGLSANAVAARVRRLQHDGVIARFTVELGPGAVGQGPAGGLPNAGAGLELYLDVRLKEGVTCDDFARQQSDFREILDAVHLTGPYDFLVRAVVPDAAALDHLVRRLKTEAGVAQTSTRLAMRPPATR